MPTKQGKSPKVDNASRHDRRGNQPGDKVVHRSKRRKSAGRISPDQTLFAAIRQDRAEQRTEQKQARVAAATRPTHVDLAREIFLQKPQSAGKTRREAGLAMIEHFRTATKTVENGRTLSRTMVAMARTKEGLSPEILSSLDRMKAVDIGMTLANQSLQEAFNRLYPSA